MYKRLPALQSDLGPKLVVHVMDATLYQTIMYAVNSSVEETVQSPF